VGLKLRFPSNHITACNTGPRTGTGFIWLRVEFSGELVNTETNGHVQLKTGNSYIDELLLASKDGLCHMESVSSNLYSSDDGLWSMSLLKFWTMSQVKNQTTFRRLDFPLSSDERRKGKNTLWCAQQKELVLTSETLWIF
jgi:hypothetical protein